MKMNVNVKKNEIVRMSAIAVAAGLLAMVFTIPASLQQSYATGNGAPSGAHYNLNIIGVKNPKTANMDGSNGHVIFVALGSNDEVAAKTKIYLKEAPEGESYQVLDANGTDSNGATFQLPNPDPDGDGVTEYSVYARALGKPGGKSTTTTCFEDINGTWCSVISMELERTAGPSKFENVSKYLLYIYQDIDGDGDIDRVPLFSDGSLGEWWEYDNNGLKLAQLRFYPESTTVPDPSTV